MPAAPRIPVLVVSGFLGSGKTTLVRHLLGAARAAGERLAVVSNELGALGIDRALIGGAAPPGAPILELEGGCVCCELSDALVEVLERLRREVRPDRIVIETSGAALPYDVQLSLWRPPVADWAGDDMAVVVVNAEQLDEARDLGPVFEQQVSAADLVLLNQIDRVAAERLPALERTLRALEPDVEILRAVHAGIDPALLVPPDEPEGRPHASRAPPPHIHERFETTVIDVAPGVEPEALVARLRALGALRAKGFVETAAGPRLVQGVGRRVELLPASAVPASLAGRVVVIRRPGAVPASDRAAPA